MSKPSPHFFRRQADGSVRVRMKFTSEEADVIEEAAKSTPLLRYLHQVINETARRDADEARRERRRSLPDPDDFDH